MRAKVNQHMAESRVIKRYHKMYVPLIELVQSLQDLVPSGMELGDKVELTQEDGYVEIAYTTKPVRIVINDGKKRFTLSIEESALGAREQIT